MAHPQDDVFRPLPAIAGAVAAREALRAAALSLPGRLFAVLDGGHFDNVQPELTRHGLEFRPLFMGAPELGAMLRGPHLVSLANGRQVEQIIDIARDQPALVFWGWPDGPEAFAQLHRHLRTINLIDVPRSMLDERTSPGLPEPDHSHPALAKTAWEAVQFRHADPRVLALLLPLLRGEQVAQFLGHGLGLVFDQAVAGGLPQTLARPAQLPEAPKGRLQISSDQYVVLAGGRMAGVSLRVAGYLRKVAPERTAQMDDASLNGFAQDCVRQSSSLGVTGSGSHCRWAYLQLLSGGQMGSDPNVQAVLSDPHPSLTPDKKVELLMRHAIQAVRGMA